MITRVSEPTVPGAAHVQAQRALLDGLRRGDDLDDLERAVRRSKTNTFTPDVAVLQVGVAAMDLAGVDRNTPIAKADLITLHLKEINFRNQRALQERTTYALNIIAVMRGGLESDILHDMYWWQTRDIVKYAVIASTAYVRACAHRRQQPVQQFVDDLQVKLQRLQE
jgi:hypothetical protein